MLRDANNPLLKLEAKISRPSRCRCFIRLRIKRASWNRLAYTVKRLNNYYKSFFSHLRTLTTWHCPHSPAAATAIDTFCPPGPQQQTCNSGFAAVDLCWDRQMDGRTPYRFTDLLYILCGQCQKQQYFKKNEEYPIFTAVEIND